MGLNFVNGQNTPKLANFPLWNPSELKAMGEDLNAVHSCAVRRDGEIKGCMYAKKCHGIFGQKGSRAAERIGDFGPHSAEPGTPGQGPEMVPYYQRSSEGMEMETSTICHIFMASVYPRMLASKHPDPDYKSDETIRILGKAGMDIYVEDLLPEDPGNCNKSKNYKMKRVDGIQRVPTYREWMKADPRAKMRMLNRKADQEEAVESMIGESAASEANAAVLEEAAAVETPRRRASRAPAQADE